MIPLRTGALIILLLSGCAGALDEPPALSAPQDEGVNVIDESSLNDLMLTLSDPEDAIAYFQRALTEEPGRAEFRRGYALALARARRHEEAVRAFEELDQEGLATDRTLIEEAHSLARLKRWEDAEAVMDRVSGSAGGPRRHLIEAMLADQRGDWAAADAEYERARRGAANPATILNNWGVSRMSRGEFRAAEKTFEEALSYDPQLFNAKNNLAVSRALRGEYRLPLVAMSEEERAIVLHNIGVIALRRGDREQAKGLFTMAVAAHPRYYPEAAEKLAALSANVIN
ncbi:tetratricopeptide repeat protein [Pikeienuella piscinae]|uniref:Tetratricopeptide repeat protein n=1 Tax=Pikeienuella piscinae TaxID=2748098 RepID=A0A7M3T5D8_9RHOB|nr:tetratricopeptide repeat protein [Pikeienuella piscinae]QIE57219.1 tetratricopeptide repeat protein [Pikeienuella piscinae]